ncbi:MAG TPA: hypothetical protein VHW66_16610 [Stellaceae bacterium]|jgi:hypothetical protein|nr:hypothetical protein [Stellaceae bacterium]
MPVSAFDEIRTALAGTLVLARGDGRGLGYFDASPGGFWRSFRAAAICFPLYLALALSRAGAEATARVVAVETIGYVISWTAFPLIVLGLVRRFERDDHFFGFMTVYNWCQVPQIVLFAALAAAQAAGLLGETPAVAAGFAATAAVLVYEWFIARVALDVSVPAAVLVVVIDLLLATTLRGIDASLY